ncbi:MAG TPA: ribonuclease P protein component [Kofleriaceae bacterium]|nr:ribonuclease P protein component [Kofleriaceae bacterium]
MEDAGPLRFRFPRSGRLRKRPEFVVVQSTGKKVHTEYFLVLVRREGTGRVGITVTKKTGNAVTRNRVKRQVREYVRQARWQDGAWLPPGRDVVIIAKHASAGRSYAELAADLARSGNRVAAC